MRGDGMKRLTALLLAAALALSLAACGSTPASTGGSDAASGGDAAPASGGEVVVYSPNSDTEVNAVIPAFEEATGIKVNALRLSAGEMLTRVAAEKDNPQASLMFGGSTDNYIAASSQGLLEAYQLSLIHI